MRVGSEAEYPSVPMAPNQVAPDQVAPNQVAPRRTAAGRPARGWWRRNLWGLLVIVPALVLALVIPFKEEVYDRWFTVKPRVPLTAPVGNWVSFSGGRLRVLDVERVNGLVDRGHNAFAVPGAQVWRARLAFDEPDEKAFAGCNVFLEDSEGQRYSDRPRELDAANVRVGGGCVPRLTFDPSPSPSPSPSGTRTRFEDAYYFALPTSARPVALRVEIATQLPRYARFILR